MSALGRVVRSGVGRRRVQTIVIGLVVMIAVSASVLGGTLLVASNAPFDRAFAQQNGAHLTAQFDSTRTTAEQLTVSGHASGVSAAAGPFRTVSISPVDDKDRPVPPLTVVGRTRPDAAAVDAVKLIEGRWATGSGELVVLNDGRFPPDERAVGTVWRLPDLPGSPTLTIVGVARSISATADGWVVPEQIAGLTTPGTAGGYQMLYRFATADTAGQVDTGRAAVRAALPADALTASRSWLTTREEGAGDTALLVPFLLAFGVLGLVMSVLIIGNVIAGAVSTGTRRIGILKALGFTPNQVVRAYLGQALIPALAGAAFGVVVGNAISLPVLALTNDIYGTSDSGVVLWVDAGVVAGTLTLAAVTAWVAASRAGRLRTVDALAVGRTPTAGRGQWAARLTARIPLPRPVTLGLAHPFARPVRSAAIVAAIAFGAAAVTFSFGLAASLTEVQATANHGDVVVGPGTPKPGTPGGRPVKGDRVPAGPTSTPRSAKETAAIVKAITAQAGTSGYCGVADAEATMAGLSGALPILATTGDGCSSGYRMVSGTWYEKPGEIVVATPFLTATQTRIGDTVVLTDHGTQIAVRIVGEAFNDDHDGMQLLTAAATLAAAEPDLEPEDFYIAVKDGTDPEAYAEALEPEIQQFDAHTSTENVGTPEVVLVINALTALLSLMLVAVAALGVLNTVVLQTRERVHEIGIHKALGMAPRQTIAMVIASVAVAGLAGGAIGTPAGVFLQRMIVTEMGRGAGYHLPASVLDVFGPVELVLFGLGGIVIAVLGALLPAGWAARTRTASALRTE
ncbi:FtsX-like permease family protein [Plantactinospora sp. S1510]|uniref:FtsX-like permease family protein n=1 Tax=Plantactinospora alkalitolerans TaxID=2789879 RepID=A0ABS0GTK8_9ACTN|nr:FtsX-like permease family protein [Plantactinospora alkalitolerans]MBF9129505.1 FtsX-like permease family protein [Plantactinospora alkalitolerans]